ncbi:hypothetical protein GH714_010368 [Hevea brasiliensis]|uniref:Uncharacterized protein n=1 Tax=Hevea brasiliensis TaxID=3981 RepID=A0A6A6MWQ0_HEVBR|nr:hypothetical protein GH714_010368 [Hevea brasiliensis]
MWWTLCRLQFHHALADGFGALHFINTWCDVARGLSNTLPPFVDRTILRCRVPPTPKFEHIEYDKPLSMDSPTQINTLQQNCIEIFKITPQQLETLKTKVKNNNGKTKSTSYEILTAHIWRCTCKARGLSDHQPTKLRIAVDGRALRDTVERIDKEIKRMDDEYLRSAIDRLEVLDDLKPILIGAHSCRCPNLIVVSWVRLPFYDADFGMGKPACVRPANPPEGKGCILQAPSDDGSWALEMCLQEDHMQSFQRLFYEF